MFPNIFRRAHNRAFSGLYWLRFRSEVLSFDAPYCTLYLFPSTLVTDVFLHHPDEQIFVVLSTIFWIVSGVLIHTLFGLIECGGVGRVAGGLSECHELKIIEWLSWALALVSVVASVPVLARAWSDWKMKKQRRANEEKNGYPRRGFVV